MEVTVVNPIKTLPISITGEACALQCDHCKAHFLKSMTLLEDIEKKIPLDTYKSLLISGGFNRRGSLPLKNLEAIERFKKRGLKLNFHLGLISQKEIAQIKNLPDMVSFDLILDDFVIKNVFHLKKDKEAFKETYSLIKNYIPISPHLLLGANYGKIEKEYDAIDFLSKEKPEKLIFIVLTPIKETPFEKISSPKLEEIEALWKYTKKTLPETNFYLGCVRPTGNYRYELDSLALNMGFKAIVNPHPNLSMSKKYKTFDECCALL